MIATKPSRVTQATCFSELVQDLPSLTALEPEWTSLFDRAGCENPFLSFEWMHEWWARFGTGHSLYVIVFRAADGELIGLAPFYLDAKCLRFLASRWVGSDHLDLIADPRFASVIPGKAAAMLLAHRGAWRQIEFASCDDDAPGVTALRQALQSQGLREVMMSYGVCPYVTLPQTFDGYLNDLSSHWRRNFRHTLRTLSRSGEVHLAVLEEKAAVCRRYEDALQLHRLRFENRGEQSEVLQEWTQAFHRAVLPRLADRGWARLYLLEVDAAPVASCYGFSVRNTFRMLQSGFDPAWSRRSVGGIAMGLSIKDCIERGHAELDLLRGEERYKFHWTRQARHSIRVRLFDRGLHGTLAFASSWLQSKWIAARGQIRAFVERRPALRRIAHWVHLLPRS